LLNAAALARQAFTAAGIYKYGITFLAIAEITAVKRSLRNYRNIQIYGDGLFRPGSNIWPPLAPPGKIIPQAAKLFNSWLRRRSAGGCIYARQGPGLQIWCLPMMMFANFEFLIKPA